MCATSQKACLQLCRRSLGQLLRKYTDLSQYIFNQIDRRSALQAPLAVSSVNINMNNVLMPDHETYSLQRVQCLIPPTILPNCRPACLCRRLVGVRIWPYIPVVTCHAAEGGTPSLLANLAGHLTKSLWPALFASRLIWKWVYVRFLWVRNW